MLPDKEDYCHRTNFEKKCRALVSSGRCRKRWIQIQGVNPNTGETINRYDCIDNWWPTLMMEFSQQQRATAAAIESMRNETVKGLGMVAEVTQMAAIGSTTMRVIAPPKAD